MKLLERSILLALILACILTSAACGSEKDGGKTISGDFISESPMNMKGRTIRILYPLSYSRPEDAFILQGNISDEFCDKMAEKFNCKIEVSNDKLPISELMKEIESGNYIADIIYYKYQFDPQLMTPLDDYVDFNIEPFSHVKQNVTLWHGKHYGMFIPVEYNRYNGLPQDRVYGNLLIYNKEMIENAGLPDILELQKTKQWTWDTFLNYAQGLTDDTDGDGVNDIWGFATASKDLDFHKFSYSNNAYLVNDSNYEDIIYDFTDQRVIETVEFLHKLYYVEKVAYLPDNNEISDTSLYTMLKNNKLAIMGGYNVIRNDVDKTFYPIGPSANNYNCTFIKEGFYFIPKTAKNPEELAVILKELYYFADNTRKTRPHSRLSSEKDESVIEFEKFVFETALNNLNFQSFYRVIDSDIINSVISNPVGCEKILKDYEEELQMQENAYREAQKASGQIQ